MVKEIRAAIISVINNDPAKKVQVAYRTNRSEVEGYPAAIVFPSEVQADYHETAPRTNQETYIFTIQLIYPFTEGQEKADLALEEAADEIMTLFRDRNILGAAADWVKPVPSVWGYQDRGNGIMRVAEVKLQAVKIISS